MSKAIRDQLAVVQRMLERQLQTTAESNASPDQFRILASIAETQLHLVRALDIQAGQAVHAGDNTPVIEFDSSHLFDLVDHKSVVDWPVDDWECPACGGERFQMMDAPAPAEVRPSDDKRWVLAETIAACAECNLTCTVGAAALSWHREQRGLDPLDAVADWREQG